MFDKANQLYHNKYYDSAAQLYQQMINDGYCSADLYYNAGNAYYRLNKIGWSIWAYEKAMQIKQHKNYNDNLSLAQKRIKDPIDEVKPIFFLRWWQHLYQLFTANVWAFLALLSFLLSFALMFAKKMKRTLYIPNLINNSLFFISAFCLLMMLVNTYNEDYHYQGIIIEPKTMFVANAKKEPIYLSEGIKIKIVESKIKNQQAFAATYVLVELPDGRIGTIDRKSFKKL